MQTYTIRVDKPNELGGEIFLTVPLAQVRDTLAGLAEILPDITLNQAPAIIEVRRVS